MDGVVLLQGPLCMRALTEGPAGGPNSEVPPPEIQAPSKILNAIVPFYFKQPSWYR